eukprot:SAG11_NODE_25351_length_360_cov_0.578544_1_plen_65_part_10
MDLIHQHRTLVLMLRPGAFSDAGVVARGRCWTDQLLGAVPLLGRAWRFLNGDDIVPVAVTLPRSG